MTNERLTGCQDSNDDCCNEYRQTDSPTETFAASFLRPLVHCDVQLLASGNVICTFYFNTLQYDIAELRVRVLAISSETLADTYDSVLLCTFLFHFRKIVGVFRFPPFDMICPLLIA